MKSSRMEKFKEKEVREINDLASAKLNSTELNNVLGGWSIDWKGWFNGSLFKRGRIDEFDKHPR